MTDTNMKVVKTDRAPRPVRRSFSRSLYDAIESLAGPATLEQIIQYLPATDDADKWSTAKPDRVVQLLKTAEYYGYVQHDDASGRYKIATKRHYDRQQEHIAELRLNEDSKKLNKQVRDAPALPELEDALNRTPLTVRSAATLLLTGFVAGVIVTLAVAGIGTIGGA